MTYPDAHGAAQQGDGIPNLAAVARTWALTEPLRASALAGGTNNLIFRIESGSGTFALVIHRNSNANAPERLAQVGDILRRLDGAGLPFAVPAPLPTVDGAWLAMLPIAGPDGERVPMTLEPYFPGDRPSRDDLALAHASGAALALLDRALAAIPPDEVAHATTWRSYGDLEHCHPLVPDPRAALADLPLATDARHRLLATYDELMARIPGLYAHLPQQLTHEDFDPSNTLALRGRIIAVLDFEFCARDVRAMDVTVAISWWPGESFGTGDEWPILRAFLRGYGQHLRLNADEIAAIPTLYLLRGYTSLIHRLGRYREGLSPLEAVLSRAAAVPWREDWLAANRDALLHLLAEEVGEAPTSG